MEPIAYLAMEIKQRELDSRLLIAAHLLSAGVPVVLGQQWSLFMNVPVLPPGVILFKTVNKIQASNMQNFKAHGHLVAATDEEVLVCFEDACFFEVFSEMAAQNCDLFFAQSHVHKTAIERRFPELGRKTVVSGNSRIDFLAPGARKLIADEAEAFRQRHGKYVLFNTNYGQINSIWNDINQVAAIAAKAGLMNKDDPASVEEYRQKLEWEQSNFKEMVRLLHWAVANLPGYKIVMRPHPGEKIEFWQNEFGKFENFVLVPRSNPYPWLLGADLVVHTACTTGLEAALLEKPTLNLAPVHHPSFDYITSEVNPTFDNWKDAAKAMADYLAHGSGPIADNRQYMSRLDSHFPDHSKGASSQHIAEGMVALLAAHRAFPSPNYQLKFRSPGFQPFARPDTLKDKFTVTAEEVVAGLQRVSRVAHLDLNLQIAAIDDSLFLLVPQRAITQ